MPSGTSHPFTCNTCQVAFRSSDLQKTHMQSDWHRYNLKRRVASLPPVTPEVFAEKVLANQATAAATAARASFEKRCESCDKTFYSENAYTNHLGSKKHKVLLARYTLRRQGLDGAETESMADSTFTLGDTVATSSTINEDEADVEDSEEDDEDEDDDEPEQLAQNLQKVKLDNDIKAGARATPQVKEDDVDGEEYVHKADLNQCLFCNHESTQLDLNLAHMSRQHSFFIPERDFLVDLPGLLNYLSETVTVLHECILCHKAMRTSSGVQTHMRDRGHCMIAYSTEDEQMEVGEYYDFRSTYSDEETDEEDDVPGGVSLGAKRAVKTTMTGENGEVEVDDEEEDGWESDSTLSSVPTDEITSVPVDRRSHPKLDLHRHHSHTDPRPHKNVDGYHSHAHHTSHAVYHDDFELHLPSGRIAGHRSLRAYFRQNLRNYPTQEERLQQRMLQDGRHDSDADDDDDGSNTEAGDDSQRGRGRQLVSRADGGLGMVGVSETKKREVKAVEKRERKRQQRAEARYQWGNEKQNNHQKHFRDPLLQ